MDIEELKKLNSLTVELKKHGMPADEAFKQAESLIRARDDVGPVVIEHAAPSQDFMLEKKFSLMLEMNNKKFQEAIDVLSKMISSVSQELASVRGELAEARQALKQTSASNQRATTRRPGRASSPEFSATLLACSAHSSAAAKAPTPMKARLITRLTPSSRLVICSAQAFSASSSASSKSPFWTSN